MLFLAALIAAAPPESRLEDAVEAFEFGEHARAVELLDGLLHPIALDERTSVLRARAYLGAGQVLLDRPLAARETFSLLLALAPDYRLDAAVFPPQVVKVFAEVRRDSGLDVLEAPTPPPEAPAPSPGAAEAPPPGAAPPSASLPELPRVRASPPSPALALVPFGVGQFANGHAVRGSLFAAAEVGLFAAAAASFVAFEGLKTPDGTFAEVDVGQAESLQTTYLLTFWTGVGIAAGGIIEALISHPGEHAAPSPTARR